MTSRLIGLKIYFKGSWPQIGRLHLSEILIPKGKLHSWDHIYPLLKNKNKNKLLKNCFRNNPCLKYNIRMIYLLPRIGDDYCYFMDQGRL